VRRLGTRTTSSVATGVLFGAWTGVSTHLWLDSRSSVWQTAALTVGAGALFGAGWYLFHPRLVAEVEAKQRGVRFVHSRGWIRFQLVVFTVGLLLQLSVLVPALGDGDSRATIRYGAFAAMFALLLAFSVRQWRARRRHDAGATSSGRPRPGAETS